MALNQVPQSGQSLNVTRDPILANFNTIDAAFLVDHGEYNVSGQGLHNRVTMPTQVSGAPTTSNQLALYTKMVNATPQLFLRRESSGSEINITSCGQSTTLGWMRFPGNILMKWGTQNVNNGSNVILFPTDPSVPVFASTPYNIQLTLTGSSSTGHAGTIFLTSIDSTLQFTVYNDSGNTKPFYWVAIGI